LSPIWDVSIHDGGVTADFLTKMLPYQKINHYPGMYVVTRKNHLARNLMRMKKAFPEEYNFFPQTWLLPQDAGEFRAQFAGL
jgi:tubulin polyglutamylase TTLL6/13